ncbi:GNAT family N-acetyltransferase [Flammeovirga sp. EKP202]|uniref:GNAT family N-acetyltransferase n=1 Tax=Flammeovirga sp. EKP202 TaxID=2770592 RepID=UPI00165EEB3A|nr:GNAT family N-acetyltransferase [Flammeovirga sp. EKP202]MBD0400649.1 GNAT family N-acetyltransferase [Flammeovirga sp. EKP202]
MKVELIKRNKLDTDLWDECINTSPQSLLFAHSWYLDIVAPDWWGVVVQEHNKYVWVMPFPVYQKAHRLFIKMPLFTPELGYFSTLEQPERFLKEAITLIQNHIPYCIEYIGNSNGEYPDFHSGEDLSIHLSEGYDTIFSSFSKSKKKNIRQSIKRNQEVQLDQNIDGFLQLFNQFTLPKIGVTDNREINAFLRKILPALVKRKKVRIYSIYDQKNQIEASSIFIHHHSRWQYFLNTADPKKKKQHGRLLIFNQFLQEEKLNTNPLHLGTYIKMPSSTAQYEHEVRRHFEQLTQKKVDVPYIKWNNLPWYINLPHQIKRFIFKNVLRRN